MDGTNAGAFPGYTDGTKYLSAGIDNPLLLEVALWQSFSDYWGTLPEGTDFKLVENDIPELRGAYPEDPNDYLPSDVRQAKTTEGKAVGCRCFASSDLGYATADGSTATFSNFKLITELERHLPDDTPSQEASSVTRRFEAGIIDVLTSSLGSYITANLNESQVHRFGVNWYDHLWSATGLDLKYSQLISGFPNALGVIQADDFKDILIRYYKIWALELMYNGVSSMDQSNPWYHPNITLASPGKILSRGVVPPEIVLVMLVMWAIGIVTLAGVYQFRRRWAEKLDTFNVFAFGVSRPEGIEPGDLTTKKQLENLPGLVGDVNFKGQVGRIGLIRRHEGRARRGKRYT
ncbi:hypothetical protein AA313_de0206209 [Arthrobotrys entomopaga]|nr:hypothetical protein AA313_de0206209 [Arthrobotrys entomopaga]